MSKKQMAAIVGPLLIVAAGLLSKCPEDPPRSGVTVPGDAGAP